METISYTILPEQDGVTVRHILRSVLHFSSHAISRLTQAKHGIEVNGVHARTVDLLHTGDILIVESGDHRLPKTEIIPGNWPLPIIWEDDYLLVVNKPAGMTAHASNFVPGTPTVAGALAYTRGTNFIFHSVNRLDKGTTGLMVIAKSGYIHDRLRRMLHTDQFVREYRAVCLGHPNPDSGIINAPIGRSDDSVIARCVRSDGQSAVSEYNVLETHGTLSLVHLVPHTGRTHQLRVHMAYLGYPLAGDWLYGTEDPELIQRPALHSFSLTLTHPVTEEILHLVAPLPEDMKKILK